MHATTRLTATATAIALALFSGVVCAQHPMTGEAATAIDARTELAEAIEIAERHSNGWAFEVEIEEERFDPVYEVMVVSKGKIVEVVVDITTGAVVSSHVDDDDDRPTRRELSLAEIVRRVVSQTGDVAYEAECDDERFDQGCEVGVVSRDGTTYDVDVDGRDGRILRVDDKEGATRNR